MICGQCGAKVSEDDVVCPVCGNALFTSENQDETQEDASLNELREEADIRRRSKKTLPLLIAAVLVIMLISTAIIVMMFYATRDDDSYPLSEVPSFIETSSQAPRDTFGKAL